MKRVLFIAEMNEITKSLNEAMLSCFQVQLSMVDQSLIGKLVQIFEPDIILIFLNGCYADVKGLRTVLKANREIPVVVVGSKYEFRKYDLEADDGQLRKLTRPVGNQGIIRALCDGVGIDYADYENAVLEKEDRRKHILFVDDNPLLLRNMKALVSDRYRVSIAVSGAQAFEILKKDCPDLIFLDYEMPVINWENVPACDPCKSAVCRAACYISVCGCGSGVYSGAFGAKTGGICFKACQNGTYHGDD